MRAIVLDHARATPRLDDVAPPSAPEGGVVVRVVATGLCRSDWHGWAGHDDDIVFPHVPGHELAGEILEVGPGVGRWRVGDRVTVPFVCCCGRCSWCAQGDAQVCPDQQQPGFTHAGSFAEQVALHAADANLVAVPEGVDLPSAAALGCRFATAYRGLVARAHLRAQEWVVVVGAGGVGLSAMMIARSLGARVVVVDRRQAALDAARALGADHVLRAGPNVDVPAAIADLTGGGAHVTMDAVGHPQAALEAILSLRRRGRHVQVGLLPPIDGHPRMPMARVIGWELDVLGSHGMAAVDYPELMALVAAGTLRPHELVERTIGLTEAAALLPGFDTAPVAGITLIDPTRE